MANSFSNDTLSFSMHSTHLYILCTWAQTKSLSFNLHAMRDMSTSLRFLSHFLEKIFSKIKAHFIWPIVLVELMEFWLHGGNHDAGDLSGAVMMFVIESDFIRSRSYFFISKRGFLITYHLFSCQRVIFRFLI